MSDISYSIDEPEVIEVGVIADSGITINYELLVPIEVVVNKGNIYRGKFSNNIMINGTAPYGSSESSNVWTIYTTTFNQYGVKQGNTVTEYNKKWSDYE